MVIEKVKALFELLAQYLPANSWVIPVILLLLILKFKISVNISNHKK